MAISIAPAAPHVRCPLCAGGALHDLATAAGAPVSRCTKCRALFFPRASLRSAFGPACALTAPASISLDPVTFSCPTCPGATMVEAGIGTARLDAHECPSCGSILVAERTAATLAPKLELTASGERPIARSITPGSVRPIATRSIAAPRTVVTDAPPIALAKDLGPADSHVARRLREGERGGVLAPPAFRESRFGFGDARVNALSLPLALALGYLIASLGGGMLIFPLRLWFHELGHACLAWMSGRAALPLPFGFTFWSEERSIFTSACFVFLLGVLGFAGIRERKPFAIGIGATLLAGHVLLGWLIASDATLEWLIAGGLAGELVISTFLIAAFFFPMPDRARWDFWRFVVLVPAAAAFASAARMWVRVVNGTQPLPMGSILGNDESGDLNRLIADYDWTTASITRSYATLAAICSALLIVLIAFHAIRWWRSKPVEA